MDSDDVQLWEGRLIAAGRALAGLTLRELAAEAGVTYRTVNRIETGGIIQVAPEHRHGAVARDTWDKIVDALERHGVELFPASGAHGAGVRRT